MHPDDVIQRWAAKQRELGNLKPPESIEELNMLGPAKDWLGARVRAGLLGEFIPFLMPEPPEFEQGSDGVWRLTREDLARKQQQVFDFFGRFCWGILVDVRPEVPVNEMGQPTGAIQLGLAFVFLDPEIRQLLGLDHSIEGRPRAQA